MKLPPSAAPDFSASGPLAATTALLEALPWGVLVLDAQGIIRHINQQATAWCGTAAEALLDQPLAEAPLPPALGAALQQLQSEAAAPREVWLPNNQQWLCLRAAPNPAGGYWVFWDNVTARKQAEAAQQRSSQLLLDIEAVAHTGSYDADLASSSLYFSDGMYRLFGEAPQAFVPTLEFINARSHPDDVATVRQVLDEAVRTKLPYTYRRRICRADGEWRTLEAHGEVRADAASSAVRLRGLVQDITERVQAEQALHESRELLRTTINSSLDMVQVFEAVRDEQGAVVDFTWVLNNAAAEQYHGDVIGQRLCQRNPGVVEEGIFDTFRQVLETGVPDQREHHYVHEQFDGWFFQSTVKLGDGVTTTTQDISQRKRTEQELLRLKDGLTQQATDKYHALFYSMDQGFCVLEMLPDETGERPIDFRYLELNPVFTRLSGVPADALGRTMRELLPTLDAFWFDFYGQVVRTGQPARVERQVPKRNRWFDVHAFRVGAAAEARVAVLFNDITSRKQTEELVHRAAAAGAFRLQLADALGPLTDPVAIQAAVMRLARRHFGADQCYYCELVDGQPLVRREAAAEGWPLAAGTYLLQAAIEAGRPFSVRDVREDERLDDNLRQLCVQLQLISYLDIPVVKEGQTAGVLRLVQSTPREWSAADAALAAEVAERTWVAVERARTEAALQKSEEKLRLFVTASSDILYRMDADWQHMLSLEGKQLLAALALPSATWVGTYIPPVDQASVVAAIRAAVKEQRFFELEHRIFRADGSTGWVISRAVPVWSAQGELTEWFCTATDITARKQAEEALRLSEERLQALVSNLPGAAVFVVGPDLRYQLAEGEALYTTGLNPASLLGRTVAEATPPSSVAEYEQHYRLALAGHGFSLEHEAYGHTYISRGVPLPDTTGQIAAVLVVSYDITERKRAEEALRTSEAQLAAFNTQLEQQVAERTQQLQESRDLLQSVFDTSLISMSVLYAVRDEAGQVQDFRLGLVNKELERETGRPDLVGKLYAQAYPGIRQAGIFDLMLRALATGEPQGMDYFYDQAGVSRWFTCQFVKLGDGLVATNLDITARKTAEQERLKNLRLLEQAEAVAGLGSWDYDVPTSTMRWSDGMYHLFGLPVGSDVSPSHYLAAVLDEDQPKAKQLVHRLAAGQGFEETLRVRVREQLKTVHMKAVVLHDEVGQLVRVLGVDLDISELQRLEADNLRLRLGQQRALFEAVQAAQEAERKRIAEGLHNGIGQILYATKLHLDRLHAPLLGTTPALAAARQEADQLLGEAIRQTRALSHELVPMTLKEFGIAAALQDICRKMSTPKLRLRCQVVLDDEAAPLPASLQTALYYIAQELAQNIAKHALGATDASLELETMPDWALLRAEDNGPGFAPGATSSPGLGLRSIRDRVALLGGQLQLGLVPTGGAYVRIRIPLTSSSITTS